MILVSHRVNSVSALQQVPVQYGVEIDLRDYNGRIVLTHDPFQDGEELGEYLSHFRHRLLILNVKCEGVEEEALRLVRRHGIEEFFFLDLSFPALVKLIRRGERRVAVRFSEYEPVEGCLALAGWADWVWADCFTRFPDLEPRNEALMEKFRLCLVSPELQGRPVPERGEAASLVARYRAAAVCTKKPAAWENIGK